MQCLHPVGHWYEVPNMLRNGTLLRLLEERPHLKYLMVHNIDTLGADVDPGSAWLPHRPKGAALTTEVIARQLEDRGGGLARVDGRVRLVEGLALPSEEIESVLSWYNSATYWIDIDQLLDGVRADARGSGGHRKGQRRRAERWPHACRPTSP